MIGNKKMFQVYVDSAANLPAETVKKYDIRVISFVNYVDGEELVCFDPDLSPEEEREKGKVYYDKIRNGADAKTSMVNSYTFEEEFKTAIEAGEGVLYFSLSKNISGTYNAAKNAADALIEEYPDCKIRLVDSLNASLAQGILAIYAVEMRNEGKSLDEVADILEGYTHKMNGLFTVGDLKYIAKTGRVSNAVAFVGNILSIKPILKGNAEGFIVHMDKVRGRKKSLNTLVEYVCKNIVNPEEQIIGIAHADAYEESLYVMDEIQKRVKVREFINTSYDYCTGTHVGPDTIALFFMGNDRELTL